MFRRHELSETLVQADDAGIVILDLTDTTFLDASALTCFMKLRSRRRARGEGPIRIVGARPHIRRLFTIAGLETAFVFLDPDAAECEAGADRTTADFAF